MKYLVIASLLMFAPLVIEQTTGLPMMTTAEAQEKKKRRKIPPMKERTYKLVSEAQLLIDPESVPVPEGEEKPDIQANPQQAVKILQDGLNRRGLNGYEVAQIGIRWRLRTTHLKTFLVPSGLMRKCWLRAKAISR